VRNVRAEPKVRAAVGTTEDVVMIDATAAIVPWGDIDETAADEYAQVSGVPRSMPGFVYVQLVPQRIQVWKGVEGPDGVPRTDGDARSRVARKSRRLS
jgi:hypothetical protein